MIWNVLTVDSHFQFLFTLLAQETSDLTFMIDGKAVHVHKSVLKIRQPYFIFATYTHQSEACSYVTGVKKYFHLFIFFKDLNGPES